MYLNTLAKEDRKLGGNVWEKFNYVLPCVPDKSVWEEKEGEGISDCYCPRFTNKTLFPLT